MLESIVFDNIVFPNMLIDAEGGVRGINFGTLFEAEQECTQSNYTKKLLEAPQGWSKCCLGYAVYRFKVPVLNNFDVILFGLKVSGISTKQGKTKNLSIRLEPEDVEHYALSTIREIQKVDDYLKSVLISNLHEIRSLNSHVYNTSYGLRKSIEQRGFSEDDIAIIKNIESLAEIQKIRSDYMDIVSGQSQPRHDKIPVYKKFDKVCKSLTPIARQKDIRINLNGASHSYIKGMRLFEVIPYLLLHNAIKYSPINQRIDVSIEEDDKQVVALLQSLGPKINADEKKQIFEKGFRGRNARAMSAEGNGIGLYFLKKLVESHDQASIGFYQEEESHFIDKGVHYFRTTFFLKLEIHEKQDAFKRSLIA